MRETEFVALVQRVERFAKAHPQRYRLSLIALAMLGYLVLGGALVVGLLLAALCAFVVIKQPLLLKVLIKFIWVPLLLMGALAKALFARISPPPGRLLSRQEVPQLYAAVDELVNATQAKPIDRILLVPEFNAFAAEVPRFGAFFPRRYLGLGLPLLQGLTPQQAKAVIAHELGHFSARDGRMGSFIYRLRQLWGRLLEEADLGILQRFMRWYAPYFNAYSFVLAREQEYAADRHGAALLGAPAMAQALTRTAALGAHLDSDFYAPLRGQARNSAEPPADLYRQMAPVLREQAGLQPKVQRAMSVRTDYADTHPALGDRLGALGAAPSVGEFDQSAAECWLGESLHALQDEFSLDWQNNARDGWQQLHLQAKAAAAQRQALSEMDERTAEQEFQLLAMRWEDREQDPQYRAELAALIDAQPSAAALYTWGAMSLDEQPEAAIEALQNAVQLDPGAELPVANLLARHFRQTGQHDRAESYLRLLEAEQEAEEAEQRRRNQLPKAGDLYTPDPGDAERQAVARALYHCRKVKRVRIARVRLADAAADAAPHYFLAVTLSGLVLDSKSHLQNLVDTLQLDGSWLALIESEMSRSLRKAMKKQGILIKR